ncbi:MAG: hypothetical protein M1823_008661, partial [Watsoniomyces obsoletus]
MVGVGPGSGEMDLAIRLPLNSPTLQFAQIITILRGIYTVMQETDTWLQGDIEEMLRYPREADLPPHPAEVEDAYEILAEAVKNCQDAEAAEFRDMCVEQVSRLRNISRCRSVVEWD